MFAFRTDKLIFAVAILAGCGTLTPNAAVAPTEVPDAATSEIELTDQAVLLDDVAGLQDVVVEADQLTLWMDGNADLDVSEGSVVVGRRGGGYLRRVLGVQREGARVILYTEDTDLSQVIRNGAWEMELQRDVLRSFEQSFGQQWDFGGRVLLDQNLWSTESGDYVNVRVHIADGANLRIDPTIRAKGEVLDGSWVDAGFQLEGSLDYEADFVVAATGKITERVEQTVFEADVEVNQMIGVVPVRGEARVRVIAGVDGRFDANAGTTLHTEAHGAVHMGAGYRNAYGINETDGWWGSAGCGPAPAWGEDGDSSTNDCFSYDISTRNTTGNLDAHLKAFVRVEMSVELYSSAGAELKVEPWANIETCNEADGAIPLGIDFDAGIRGEHAYHFSAFGWSWLSNDWGPYPFDSGVWDVYPSEPYTCGAIFPEEAN